MANNDTDLTARDFWDDIIAAAQDVISPPVGAITLEEFMERAQVNAYRARKVLMQMVQDGRLKTCIYGKKRYWWPERRE